MNEQQRQHQPIGPLYGFLEPEWGFSGYAPNIVPYDVSAGGIAPVANAYEFRWGAMYPGPRYIIEAPKPRNESFLGWPTASQAYFIIPANAKYYGLAAWSQPAYQSNIAADAQQIASTFNAGGSFLGGTPTVGIYTGSDDACTQGINYGSNR